MEDAHLFHDPQFNVAEAHIRELERSVSPFEIPNLLPSKPAGITEIVKEQVDLRLASDNPTVVMELDLDGNIRYVSKNWEVLVGTSIKKILNKPISNLLIGSTDADLHVFNNAVAQMIRDDALYKVKFVTATNDVNTAAGVAAMSPLAALGEGSLYFDYRGEKTGEKAPEKDADDKKDLDKSDTESTGSAVSNNGDIIELEAQGILIHDPANKLPTHSIWTIKPFVRIDLELSIPEALVDLLGFGSEIFEGYLLNLKEAGIIEEDSVPEPKSILCRICETNIPAWFIEKHSDLCLVEHREDEELQFCHDTIADQRDLVLKISESLWHQQFESPSGPSTPSSTVSSLSSSSNSSSSLNFIYEYKGLPLPSMAEVSSPRAQPRPISSFQTIRYSKKFPFGILERLVEYCDEALMINPAEKQDTGELQFSPNTERAISTVMHWKALETSDPAIRALVADTQKAVTDKVDNLTRLISIIQYSDKIKQEVDELVLQSVKDTVSRIREKTHQKDNPEQKLRTLLSKASFYRGSESSLDFQRSRASSNAKIVDALEATAHLVPVRSMSPNLPQPHASNLHSPQPSRVRSPTSRILGEVFFKNDSRTSIHSVSPRDLLRERPQEISRPSSRGASTASSASSLSRHSKKDIADSLNDLDLSKKPLEILSNSSSFSSPRRHLSPVPYVEKQSMSSFQKNTSARFDSPVLSPHTDLDDAIPPVAATPPSEKRSSSGSLTIPVNTPNHSFFPPTGHARSSLTSSAKPPLSPLLVSQTPASKPTSGGIKDYEIIKAISKGAFGSVFLAKRRLTGDYVAIKCLKKRDMIAKNQVLNVKSERAVMMKQTDSPYVAQLYSSFQSKDYLYLVMEYLNGGDVATLLKMLGTLGDKWGKRYIAEVIVGVNDLHKRGIIHRDLKPDNLLIDSSGHLKLTDFGLSSMGVVGRHTIQHRKSSTSEHAIEVFRKNLQNNSLGQSPLITGYGPGDSPDLFPNINHKRTLSVTPFSLSPTMEHLKLNTGATHGTAFPSGSSPSDSSPLSMPLGSKKRSGSLLRGSSGTRSGSNSSGMDSPALKPALPSSPSESSFAIVDDEFQMSPLQSENAINSYALYDPNQDDNGVKKFVGTPDYLAPETITGVNQGYYSDWWSIGCILFEFLFGYPPFHADTPDKVFKNILSGEIDWPPLSEEEEKEICPPDAKDLIRKLILLDFEKRLGYNGAEEIMLHPYFQEINWDTLYLDVPDSFIPVVDDPESTDYFDSRGADISHFPQDESDEELERAPVSAKELGSPQNFFTAGLQVLNLSLPSSPMVGKRERRGSKLADPSEFGSFHFRNLNVLEKANKDVINRLKTEHLEHRNSFSSSSSDSSPLGFPKPSRGLSVSATVVNSGSPFKRPVSPVAHRPTSPNKERTQSIGKRDSIGSEERELRPRLLATSLSKQLFLRNVNDLIHSPSGSDTEESNSALMRVRQRRESIRRNGSTGSGGGSAFSTSYNHGGRSEEIQTELDVLYCEPIPIVRHTVARMMEKNGCIVLSVPDGDDLIRRATSQVKFDLIFTALRLPKVDAIDAVKLIKYTSGVNSNTPVVAITGFAREASDLGLFDEVLEKPVDGAMLRSAILKFQRPDVAVESDED